MYKISFINGKWTSKKERRRAMWEKDSHCYWCGIETILFNGFVCPLPDFAATIEHVYPRSHNKRKKYKRTRKQSPMVLACFSCNQRRGKRCFHEFANFVGVSVDLNKAYN